MTLLRTLSLANQERGDDATGLAYLPTGATLPTIVKACVPATRFPWTVTLDEPSIASSPWLIGHTRNLTVGENTLPNAHPFQMGNTCGAHNGHITNHALLPVDKTKYALPDCDSAAFLALIDQVGVKKAFERGCGSAALSYTQAPYTKLRLICDPLSLVWLRHAQCLVWSSEESHLLLALAVAGFRLDQDKELHDGCLMNVPTNGNQITLSSDSLTLDAPVTTWREQSLPFLTHYPNTPSAAPTTVQALTSDTPSPDTTLHDSIYGAGVQHPGSVEHCLTCMGTLPAARPSPKRRVIIWRNGKLRRKESIRLLAWPPMACPICRSIKLTKFDSFGYDCASCNTWLELEATHGAYPHAYAD